MSWGRTDSQLVVVGSEISFGEQMSWELSWSPFHVKNLLGVAWSRLESKHEMATHWGRVRLM